MGNLKNPIEYTFDLNSKSQPKVLCVTHTDDDGVDVIKLIIMQGETVVDLSEATVTARMVMRWTHELLNDNVSCEYDSESGSVMIPIDSATIPMRSGEMLVEVNIKSTVNDETLTLQFPLIVRVNGSILGNAEITPDSRGTIPELLQEVEQELERVKGLVDEAKVFEILDNALSGNRNISPTLLVDRVTDQTYNPNGDLILYYIDSDDVRHNIFNFSPYLGTKDYNALQNRPVITGSDVSTGVATELEGYMNFSSDGFILSKYEAPDKQIDIELSKNVPICKTGSNDWAGRYDFDEITNVFARSGVFKVSPERTLNVPTALEEITREVFYVIHLATMADDVSIIRYAIGCDNYVLKAFMQTATLHRNNAFSYDVDYQSDWTEIGARGEKGDPGATGADGYSPTATVTQTQNGATVSITDKNGTTTANISNGSDGFSPTISTSPGYLRTRVEITDVNGTQYFYINDGESVKSAVIDANGDLKITIQGKPSGSSVHPTYPERVYNVGHVVGADGSDYILTAQDKSDIADLVLAELPTTQGVQYGNTGN